MPPWSVTTHPSTTQVGSQGQCPSSQAARAPLALHEMQTRSGVSCSAALGGMLPACLHLGLYPVPRVLLVATRTLCLLAIPREKPVMQAGQGPQQEEGQPGHVERCKLTPQLPSPGQFQLSWVLPRLRLPRLCH